MASIPTISEHIEITPGVCGGRPQIAGHRIRVEDIVIWYLTSCTTPRNREYERIGKAGTVNLSFRNPVSLALLRMVQDLRYERMGMSPDEIIYHHPSLTLADIYNTLGVIVDVSDVRS